MVSTFYFGTFKVQSNLNDSTKEQEIDAANRVADNLDVVALQEVNDTSRWFIQTLRQRNFQICSYGDKPDTAVAFKTTVFQYVKNLSETTESNSSSQDGPALTYGKDLAVADVQYHNVPFTFFSLHIRGQDEDTDQDEDTEGRVYNYQERVSQLGEAQLERNPSVRLIYGGDWVKNDQQLSNNIYTWNMNFENPSFFRRIWNAVISIFKFKELGYRTRDASIRNFLGTKNSLSRRAIQITGGPSTISRLWHYFFGKKK
jgi:hypothetical protein